MHVYYEIARVLRTTHLRNSVNNEIEHMLKPSTSGLLLYLTDGRYQQQHAGTEHATPVRVVKRAYTEDAISEVLIDQPPMPNNADWYDILKVDIL